MKLKVILVLPVVLVAIAIVGSACRNAASVAAPSGGSQKVLYYTCSMHPNVKADKPGDCPICGMTLQPVYGTDAITNAPPSSGTNASAGVKPYPLDVCLADGMKLGSMGTPYVFDYQGQEIKFCCANCKPQFLNDPAKYLKKLQDAQASQK